MAVNFTHDVLMPADQLKAPRAVVVRVDDIYGRSVGGGEQQLAQSLGINVVDVIEYNPNAYDPDIIALRLAEDRPDFLYDVSYLDDGIAIWQAVLRHHVALKGAIGTSSAFCMPLFGQRLGAAAIGVYAADKPDANISPAALSAAGRGAADRGALDLRARQSGRVDGDLSGRGVRRRMDALPRGACQNERSDQLGDDPSAALKVDVPVGDSINGGGVRFAGAGALDEGQNTRAAAVVGQWQAVGVMKVLYPAAYSTGTPIIAP